MWEEIFLWLRKETGGASNRKRTVFRVCKSFDHEQLRLIQLFICCKAKKSHQFNGLLEFSMPSLRLSIIPILELIKKISSVGEYDLKNNKEKDMKIRVYLHNVKTLQSAKLLITRCLLWTPASVPPWMCSGFEVC